MISFLEETIDTLLAKHKDIEQLAIILPSKRAGGFFKNYLRKRIKNTTFLPEIMSIEGFIESLADLQIIDNTQLILHSYEAYSQTKSIAEKEDFETYTSWIQTLLNDFNEIDRHLVDTDAFFSYLGSIKSMEKWTVNDAQTELITNYLSFWNSLPEFYRHLRNLLLEKGLGYQGLVYRKACEELEHYIAAHETRSHIFIGFNALNKAEQFIIKELLETGHSEIYFDADTYFLDQPGHSAGFFLHDYFTSWKYLVEHKPQTASNFEKPKSFHFIEAQKNIAQAKYAGQLISRLAENQLNNTAVVLADENLLVPLLYSLPEHIKNINITMGIPLKNLPASIFFQTLLGIHQHRPKSYYYKDVLSILNNPTAAILIGNASTIVREIAKENRTYLSVQELRELAGKDNTNPVELLFGDWEKSARTALENCLELLLMLREPMRSKPVEKVLVYELYSIFEGLELQSNNFPQLSSIKSLNSLFQEATASATLDFEGDAYNGLQIMGVLETRVLDFENIILTSVNEGLLPSGKSAASFITYDLKTQFDLPLYTDKDAIYTYHFYHMLQRASNIWLLYNNHSEGLNTGERSRFLLQLEVDLPKQHTIDRVILAPKAGMETKQLQQIKKTSGVLDRLQELAEKGFSPSALTAYIRNPLDFYLERILHIRETDSVEETVDYNTLGTIVHNTLQVFYEPLENTFLSKDTLQKRIQMIPQEVTRQFEAVFKKGTFGRGKNLLIFEVAKRYVENMLKLDISLLEQGNAIRIIHVERNMKIPLDISELPFPIFLQGTVDRVDEFNGILRIIDYKTGNVTQSDLEIVDWAELTADYKYSKAFQVLAYAQMFARDHGFTQAEAGVISFKNLGGGFLKFATKASAYSRTKDRVVSEDTLACFSAELKSLILEICNPEFPFTEKEV